MRAHRRGASVPLVLAAVALAPVGGCSSSGGEMGPPVPASIVASVTPARAAYRTGETVLLDAAVLDATGVEIAGVPVVWAVSPDGGASIAATGRATLSALGRVTFEACTEEPDRRDRPLCDAFTINVDDGSPVLEVTEPTPGAELGGGGATDYLVRGSVSDMGMANVFVNGVRAVPDALGTFEARVPAHFGVEHLVVVASDGVLAESRVEMDVLFAEGYAPGHIAAGDPGIELDEGAALLLGPAFFDDGVPVDVSARPIATDDLADLAALVLSTVDVGALLPDPVVDSRPTLFLRVPDVRLGEVSVSALADDDAIELFLRIGRLEADTLGTIMVDTTSIDLTGGIEGGVAAYARVRVMRRSAVDPIVVELESMDLAIERVVGRFDSPQANALFTVATGLLRSTLEAQLQTALEGSFATAIPDLLRGLFESLDGALMGQRIPLDTGIFAPVTIAIEGSLVELTSVRGEGVTASLSFAQWIEQPSMHPTSRGVALASADPSMDLRFLRGARLSLGVRLALLNGLIHSLWDTGLLEVDATTLLPASVSSIVSEAFLHGRMTPIVRAAGLGEEHDLVLAIGQLELDAIYTGDPVHYGMTLEAGLDLSLAANRLTVTIAEEPFIRVWAKDAASERALSSETLRGLLLTMLWPSLRTSLADGLSLELPLPPPDALAALSPELAGLALTLEQTAPVELRGDTLVIEGVLSGAL